MVYEIRYDVGYGMFGIYQGCSLIALCDSYRYALAFKSALEECEEI